MSDLESERGGVLVSLKLTLGQVSLSGEEENNFHSSYVRAYFPTRLLFSFGHKIVSFGFNF